VSERNTVDWSFERVVARMSEPSFYSPPPAHVEVHETHVSVVFLAGDRAYKLKKPVRMPFLDYSTRSARRHFCEEEVRLNRRFAPDVYLGVRGISEHDGDLALTAADDPAAREHVVVMRRYDEDATLERLVARGAADFRLANRVGSRVAELHRAAPPAPAGHWTPAYVAERIAENFDTVRPAVGVLTDRLTFDALERFSRAFLRGHRGLLERRAAAGMVRDVHGDLRAEHVLIERDRISLVDCVEFDARMRRIDVAADIAFLTMDLERLGARPLAEAAERAYVAATGDPDARLLCFYACYRACVRGKVAAIRVHQLDRGDPLRAAMEEQAQGLFALALRLAWRARLPLAVVFCGVAGSGKSTLAAELARRSGLPHLTSDRVRKELAGLPPERRGGPDLYEPEAIARTYAELAARARAAQEAGTGAIVDATFHRAEQRAALRGTGARVLWIECRAPEEALRARTAAREHAPERGSDATWPVAAAQLEAWETLDEIEPRDRHVLHTDRPVDACLAEVDSFVSAAVEGGSVI
jgi:aminoglycoside phosphotransferase family enzyme/predicted kinase